LSATVGDVFVSCNLLMAICLIALAPTVVLVLLLRKFVVQGLSAGAVKG
jgi:multiple sugar transport system permease protein